MTLTSDSFASDDAPDSSCPTVRYPDPSTYEGLDAAMIERSDSVFPTAPPSEPEPDAWLEPLPLVSTTKWMMLLHS